MTVLTMLMLCQFNQCCAIGQLNFPFHSIADISNICCIAFNIAAHVQGRLLIGLQTKVMPNVMPQNSLSLFVRPSLCIVQKLTTYKISDSKLPLAVNLSLEYIVCFLVFTVHQVLLSIQV